MDGGYGGLAQAGPTLEPCLTFNKFDYQPKFINDIREEMKRKYRRVAGIIPTGGGKSYVFMMLARSVSEFGGEIRYIAPRIELVKGVGEKMEGTGMPYSMHATGIKRPVGKLPSVQLWCCKSFMNYMKWFNDPKDLMPGEEPPKPKHVNLFVIDEAHVNQDSIIKIIKAYPKSRFIFLTATPLPGMDRYFETGKECLVHGPSVKELTERGVLVPAIYKSFEPDNLEAEYLRGEIVSTWLREGENRPTVVFCKNRREAKHIYQRFLLHGVKAEYMDALTKGDDRKKIFDRLEAGESKVLINVKVMEYGVDKPFFSCAVLAYAVEAKLEDNITRLAGYIQRAGRVLRAATGKKDALIICLTGIVNMFKNLDEEREWEIESKKLKEMANEEARSVKKEKEDPKLITCQQCKHQFIELSHCPQCGTPVVHQAQDDVPHVDATIAEIDLTTLLHKKKPKKPSKLWTPERARDVFADILWCVRNTKKKDGSSYKDGMAYHVYKRLHTGIPAPAKPSTLREPDDFMKQWVKDSIRSHNAARAIKMKAIQNKIDRQHKRVA